MAVNQNSQRKMDNYLAKHIPLLTKLPPKEKGNMSRPFIPETSKDGQKCAVKELTIPDALKFGFFSIFEGPSTVTHKAFKPQKNMEFSSHFMKPTLC